MADGLTEFDAQLLNLIQVQIPLSDRPFERIAAQLGTAEDAVLARLADLKARRVIRQISAIFDSKSLGYQSTLVAARVDPTRIEEAAAIISQHPGVSHNYQRDHSFNLWYTLAVPPDSRLGLAATVDRLHAESGSLSTRMLPTLKLFKIGVKFDVSGESDLSARADAPAKAAEPATRTALTEADKRMIRVLQQDLPLESRPFDAWARQAEVSVAELLAGAERFGADGRMRRFSAVLRHREVGFSANGMGTWAVPAGQEEAFGKTAGSFAAVTHCYLRPTYPDWPYNVFTMVHAPSREACDGVFAAIAQATGVTRYTALYSTREFKKIRVKYFTGDTRAWEASRPDREMES